jgi:nucleotide-binding universal stress UspA family protein
MGIFNSIVAPTDLGDGSAAAVQVAAAVAQDCGASLCVIHVYAVPQRMFAVYPMLASFAPSLPLQEAADAALRDWTAGLDLGVEVDLIARTGAVTETVLDEVETRNADLVVIGTHVERLPSPIIGSTAQKIIRACPVPVLTVRPETGARARRRASTR